MRCLRPVRAPVTPAGPGIGDRSALTRAPGPGPAFGLVALVQGVLAFGLTVGLLGLHVAGPSWALPAVAVADGLLRTALGLFVSAFAATEFQAVQ